MKILCWAHAYWPDMGGIQTLLLGLLPQLRKYGHEIVVIASHTVAHPEIADEEMHDGFAIYRYRFHEIVREHSLPLLLKVRRDVSARLAAFQPDIIHFHPAGPEILTYLQVTTNIPARHVLTMHNNYKPMGVRLDPDTSFGKVAAQADWVTAVSADALNWVDTDLKGYVKQSSLVHNGVARTKNSPAPLAWDPPHLLFAGRMVEQKNLHVLLAAFSRLTQTHPDAQMTLVGEGPLLGELRQQAGDLGISGQVYFRQTVTPEEIERLINRSTAIVFASAFEGLPMFALEGAQLGRPIIATRVGGMAAIVRDGETGYLVATGDEVALADAFYRLLSDQEQAQRMGAAARRLFLAQFTIEHCAAAYQQVYLEVMNS